MPLLFLLGRVIFAVYFLEAAWNHIINTNTLVGYAESKGVPEPRAAIIISGFLLAFGGVSILFGVAPRAGLAAIILFLLPVTYMMHAFWKETDPKQRHHEKMSFLKNIMIFGACLMLLSVPTPWVASLGA
ncbi:MAG: DoxX family protein [Patescibacteria group bacterium]